MQQALVRLSFDRRDILFKIFCMQSCFVLYRDSLEKISRSFPSMAWTWFCVSHKSCEWVSLVDCFRTLGHTLYISSNIPKSRRLLHNLLKWEFDIPCRIFRLSIRYQVLCWVLNIASSILLSLILTLDIFWQFFTFLPYQAYFLSSRHNPTEQGYL